MPKDQAFTVKGSDTRLLRRTLAGLTKNSSRYFVRDAENGGLPQALWNRD